MFSFKDKQWWKSKTFWTAVIMGVVVALRGLGIEVPNFVLEALAAFGLYSIRDAVGGSKVLPEEKEVSNEE